MGQHLVGEPLEKVAIEILSPVPRTEKDNKKDVIAIVSDYFTRWIAVSYPVKNQEAITIAMVFMEEFVIGDVVTEILSWPELVIYRKYYLYETSR
jgi:hypothetical protein